MKILFCSNYFTHHQQPLSDELHRRTNGGFAFLGCRQMEPERIALGWREDSAPAYVRSVSDADASHQRSDVLIAGSFPREHLEPYVRGARLVFRYAERPLKKGDTLWKYPVRFLRWRRQAGVLRSAYLLCAGGFVAGDYAKYAMYHARRYQWGYFPETRRYASITELIRRKEPAALLWCGRFLDWKHPDDAVLAAERLKAAGYRFRLRMIGAGPMEETLRAQVARAGLTDCVSFAGTMPPDAVRDEMERAQIYLFTSDRQEGWGAVLNEAMNSGCAVIAGSDAGATPCLVKNGVNGLVYPSGNADALTAALKRLLDAPETAAELGRAAYETIANLWNAETAAERLIRLSEAILSGDRHPDLFRDGPCSRAEHVRKDWYRK